MLVMHTEGQSSFLVYFIQDLSQFSSLVVKSCSMNFVGCLQKVWINGRLFLCQLER